MNKEFIVQLIYILLQTLKNFDNSVRKYLGMFRHSFCQSYKDQHQHLKLKRDIHIFNYKECVFKSHIKCIPPFLGPLGPLVVALSVSLSVILIAHILNYTVYPNIMSSTALQHHSTAAPQHCSTIALQHHSTAAPQHCRSIALQYHSTVAQQHC